jgi:hypothetical protein
VTCRPVGCKRISSPSPMKQCDLKLPRLYSTVITAPFCGEDREDPDCLQRGYIFGGSFLLSLSEVKKTKSYAVNDCNTIEFW